MTKTEKKIDNAIRIALTSVCKLGKVEISGFKWLSHQVNFAKVDQTLIVHFIFDSHDKINEARIQGHISKLVSFTEQQLMLENIVLANASKQCRFTVL
ncbi:hypothetical protein TUM4438_34340 [Shewanella sairae]|uniref:Fis family transcriptional regulator n=1 Tax=Shewanella sairae TaxID=190310 RepID=A0ABQ4PN90_9GAMM|nr:Fis family transcriptional regulator [Shewanella sairae]MCL1131936.1 Fis family transcriptional regulator [Shewanella sairae]GIU49840.1 hypothetical protein TUM4438_34340 [Shewanella sairae]